MNRFNLAVSCFAIAAACLLAGGCGGGNSPKGAVSRYLEAMEDRDIETVLKLVNWEGEKTPHYRVTELAFIREWMPFSRLAWEQTGFTGAPPSFSR